LSKAAHSGPSARDSEREPHAHSLHFILDRTVWGAAELAARRVPVGD